MYMRGSFRAAVISKSTLIKNRIKPYELENSSRKTYRRGIITAFSTEVVSQKKKNSAIESSCDTLPALNGNEYP